MKLPLKKFGLPLEPDHVILFFYINDFEKTNIERRYQQYANMDWYAFDLSDKPTPGIVDRWSRRQLLRRSAFVMWAHDTLRGLSAPDNIETKMLTGVVDDETREAERFTRESLAELVHLSKVHDFSLTLAVIPIAAQIGKEFPTENYQSFLQQVAEQYAVSFVDMLPMLREAYLKSGAMPIIPFEGHYNDAGHKILGTGMQAHLQNRTVNCQ
jgi:hypothetical protein